MATATLTNRYAETFGNQITMFMLHCANCGIPFAIPTKFDDQLRETKKEFHCPNGHSNVYGDSAQSKQITSLASEKRKLQDDLAAKERENQAWIERWQSKVTENKGLKIKAGKLKKRIANGVCPCCHRTFQNLAEHMKHQHPDEIKSTKDIII